MGSLHSSLPRFFLVGESESQGEVTQMHWGESKKRNGGRGWGGKEKPAAEPYILPNAIRPRMGGN